MNKKRTPLVKWNTAKKNTIPKWFCPMYQDVTVRENPDILPESSGMYYDINQVPEEMRQVFTLCEQMLTPKQNKIINLIFRRHYTQEEVARYMKISQQMVSKHYMRAIVKLRRRLINEKTGF